MLKCVEEWGFEEWGFGEWGFKKCGVVSRDDGFGTDGRCRCGL
ncbi:hypothetical protein [Streptomyces sp. NBC_01508]